LLFAEFAGFDFTEWGDEMVHYSGTTQQTGNSLILFLFIQSSLKTHGTIHSYVFVNIVQEYQDPLPFKVNT